MALMTFVVLEGFSGTGKTSLAQALERMGWMRLQESAHAVPRDVPVADRADTAADFSLLGATMTYSSVVSKLRGSRNIVSEGYFLSDLAYAKIRYELKKSDAYPSMLTLVKRILEEPSLRPDLYLLLKAGPDTINHRQLGKDERERNTAEYFRNRYYTALAEIHDELQETNTEVVETDHDVELTIGSVVDTLERRKVIVV
jgi:thymidylate kinase